MKKICIVFVCLTLIFSSVGFSTAVRNDTITLIDEELSRLYKQWVNGIASVMG